MAQLEQMKTSLKRWSRLLEFSSSYSIHSNTRHDGRFRFRPTQGVNFVGMITNGEADQEWGGHRQ
eukprot:7379769-Prorocentrum_lima.AAC.1